MTILTRQYKHFFRNYGSTNIATYFGINNDKNITKTCLFEIIDSNNYLFTIKYVSNMVNIKDYDDKKTLPLDVIHIISSYLPEFIELKCNVHYPNNYPYDPPIWSFSSASHNIITHDLEDYYKYIIENHNNRYIDWSPALWIEKDLLSFIQKINHFEHMSIQ